MNPIAGTPILTAAQMRAAEDTAIAAGTSAETLMARAGAGIAQAVRRLAAANPVLILCGPGNNGGDGYVAATILAEAGLAVRVAALREPRSAAGIAARAGWTGPVEAIETAESAPVLVDALFGTGLKRPLEPAVIAQLLRLKAEAQLTIAVDVPSGVGDAGECPNDLPEFDVTIALGAVKPGHVLHPAAAKCGAIRIVDIGVDATSGVTVLDRPVLSRPTAATHKYTRGMVAVVAGAMPGAAALAASAAARAGAGYALLLGSATDRLPHAIVRRRYDVALLADARIGAVVIGPGLGRDERAAARVADALETPHPLVIDGDALRLIDPAKILARTAPTILTPHAGEFDALFGAGEGSKIDRARAAARETGATIVFKGADTVVAHPDGTAQVAIADAPWLSTAGTGDVLAGAIGALLAGGHADPAAAGVWLHSEAARSLGPAFLADDLPGAIAQCL